jgi:hypothetical protein
MARKRAPANTAEQAVKAMVDAALGLPDMPAHAFLQDSDLPFWVGIVQARARDEWTDADLVVACQLARCQADIEGESRLLREEGGVLTNDRGTPVSNPRICNLDVMCRREMALMRTLRLGGSAAGVGRDLVPMRMAAKAARQVREELPDDGLLAR